MCGRYRRTTSEEELARRYHIRIPPQRDLPISWNIAPTQDVLAIGLHPETKQRTLNNLRCRLERRRELRANVFAHPGVAEKLVKFLHDKGEFL